jgi:hypothetical protein
MCSHTFVSPKGNRDIHVFCFSFISNQVWSKENQVHLFPKRNLTSCVGGSHTHFCEVHDSSPLCCRRWTARATADMAQATCEHDSPNLKHVKVIFLLWEWWKNITVNKSLFVFIFKQVCVFRAVSTNICQNFCVCFCMRVCAHCLCLTQPCSHSELLKFLPIFLLWTKDWSVWLEQLESAVLLQIRWNGPCQNACICAALVSSPNQLQQSYLHPGKTWMPIYTKRKENEN